MGTSTKRGRSTLSVTAAKSIPSSLNIRQIMGRQVFDPQAPMPALVNALS
jgi:hypothetical protein